MKTPLFEIIRHFIITTNCKANAEYKGMKFLLDKKIIKIDQNLEFNPSNNIWTMALQVSMAQDAPVDQIPYFFSITAVGNFECNATQDLIEKEMPKLRSLMFVNSASLLYGSVREYLRMITSVGPHGPFVLPTIAFDSNDDTLNNTTEKENSLPKPQRKRKKAISENATPTSSSSTVPTP